MLSRRNETVGKNVRTRKNKKTNKQTNKQTKNVQPEIEGSGLTS